MRRQTSICSLVGVGLFLISLLPTAAAQSSSASETLDPRTARSLEAIESANWFDSDSQSARPVPLQSSDADAANRDSRWNQRRGQSQPSSTPAAGGGAAGGGGAFFDSVTVTWVMLILLALVLMGILLYAVSRIESSMEGQRKERRGGRLDEEKDETKLAALPVDIRKPTGDLLDEARRLMEAGQFDAAIVYLFGHILIQLDEHQLIRLARGKTNRQYLHECRAEAPVKELLHDTILAFEDSFFGHHPLSQTRFMAVWQRLGHIDKGIGSANG